MYHAYEIIVNKTSTIYLNFILKYASQNDYQRFFDNNI